MMEIQRQLMDDITFIRLNGKLDTSSVEDFSFALDELILTEEQKLIIDFSQVTYISSLGLRVLLIAGKSMNKNNGKLALCTLKHDVKEVFDLAGFSMLFNIFTSENEAIGFFGSLS